MTIPDDKKAAFWKKVGKNKAKEALRLRRQNVTNGMRLKFFGEPCWRIQLFMFIVLLFFKFL